MADLPPFDIDRVRADFPVLSRTVYDKPLTYLDSAATTHKPQAVIDRLVRFYAHDYGTVRRGVYLMSQESTAMYEAVRAQAARFIGADRPEEVVFVRGVTEAMNLLAQTYMRQNVGPGDEVIVSEMEHHANIVPWQIVAEQVGATVKAAPITDRGEVDLEALDAMLTERVKLVSMVHVSNGLGTVNPVARIAEMAHAVGAVMVVDGAQSAAHLPVDVGALGCDFFACSGHKMLGPTGVGLLWGRYDLLASMPPYQGGGEMIDRVTFEGTTFDDPPYRFEAGTPPFAQVVGFGAALTYLEELGMENVAAHDAALMRYATDRLGDVPGLRFYGEAEHRSGLVSFAIDGIHSLDVGTILDREGVCIRVGQHCVQPTMDRFGIHSTARASFGVYTSKGDIDALVAGLGVAVDLLR